MKLTVLRLFAVLTVGGKMAGGEWRVLLWFLVLPLQPERNTSQMRGRGAFQR
jgi:hypothetical protein